MFRAFCRFVRSPVAKLLGNTLLAVLPIVVGLLDGLILLVA